MASPTHWIWVWASSGRWWRTGKPGMLQCVETQRIRQDWVTEQLNKNTNFYPLKRWTASKAFIYIFFLLFLKAGNHQQNKGKLKRLSWSVMDVSPWIRVIVEHVAVHSTVKTVCLNMVIPWLYILFLSFYFHIPNLPVLMMPIFPVFPGLRGFPRHETFSTKTWKIPGKPRKVCSCLILYNLLNPSSLWFLSCSPSCFFLQTDSFCLCYFLISSILIMKLPLKFTF